MKLETIHPSRFLHESLYSEPIRLFTNSRDVIGLLLAGWDDMTSGCPASLNISVSGWSLWN